MYKEIFTRVNLFNGEIFWDGGKPICQYRGTEIKILFCLNKSTLHWGSVDQTSPHPFPCQLCNLMESFIGLLSSLKKNILMRIHDIWINNIRGMYGHGKYLSKLSHDVINHKCKMYISNKGWPGSFRINDHDDNLTFIC